MGENGNFNDPIKWSPSGTPDGDDAAIFRAGGQYTVGFPGNPPFATPAEYFTDRLRVGSNTVTFARASSQFAQGPVSYTVLNSTTEEAGRGIIIGELDSDTSAVLNLAPTLPLSGVAATLGDAAGASGTLNINGSALNLTVFGNIVRPLIVGNHGNGVLNVNNGADVNLSGTPDIVAVLGNYSGSSGTLAVSGAGSTWNSGGELLVGNSGEGTLTIDAAASVSNIRTTLGFNSGSTGSITVTGAGSTLTSSFEMVVGNSGTLTIDNGGNVSDRGGYIGFNSGSNGQVTIDGPGSTWTNSGSLHVGYLGSGTLTVRNGAAVSSTAFSSIGNGFSAGFSSTGAVTVDGPGSTWTNSDDLSVGAGASGTMTIQNGGVVSNTSALIAAGANSSSMVEVNGAGSTWINSGRLQVGAIGIGTLAINGGGHVTSGSGVLAREVNSSGTVVLEGSGSNWTISGGLDVAGFRGDDMSPLTAGGTGTLTINAGTSLSVGQDILLFPGGKVRLYGGTLDVGTVHFEGGEQFQQFHWIAGSLHVDNFIGNLSNDGGTLAPGHSIGSTTIGGSYVQAPSANLRIELGTPVGGQSNDAVNVSFNASLNGQLQLTLIDGLVPDGAQTFTILAAGIQAGSLSGAFSNVANGQRLTTTDGLGSFVVNYGAGSAFNPNHVVLSNFLASGLPGDYNHNGIVDAADYVLWRKNPENFGGTPAGYNIWRANFGRTAGSASSAADVTSTIPEPKSIALLSFAAILRIRRQLRNSIPT